MVAAIQVLVTLAVLSFAVVAVAADLNRTHATNPRWVGHARFHVVWQAATHVGIGVLAVVLTWAPLGPRGLRVGVAVVIAAVVLAGFFVAMAAMRSYGGQLADPNGYRPVLISIAGRRRVLDKNVALFVGAALMLSAAVVLIVINGGV
ncbi:putative uncharacterized protein [Mycolicibacterium canariasense]|uniref:Integral membrane protein n=1 Tax=Mycolicibacterium canariasense TaxID=228230 RepID=A0A100W9D8_MYCCR|nr:hypothetical protein [Mycolicibacterium canariasense]MCV7212869.1 hypothetical protein [Mycolicibacterium canariasense]ORV19271.1 hypothetical protein AWB94_32440 [Mycolicibacterium canariasense]GAS93841.1 putative uncharacterized protein [Mycolicibacterium canariasense]